MVEGKGRIVAYLLVVRERRGRVTRPDGGGLPVEFYKSTAALARDAFRFGAGGLLAYFYLAREIKKTYSRGWSRRREGL